jgi:hypothetical protein
MADEIVVEGGQEFRSSVADFGGTGSVKEAGAGSAPAAYDWGWDAPEPDSESSFEDLWKQKRGPVEEMQFGDIAPPEGGGGGPMDFAGAGGVVKEAMKYVGTPYVWGGSSPLGFDCSGFTQYVFKQMGISLPRISAQQGTGGQGVSRDAMQAGDLVFFDWGSSGHNMGADHVGIYIGGGKYIHAPQPGQGVKISELSGNYWARRYSK